MRLSTTPDRDHRDGVAVIHAALAAGAEWLDTADVYCRDETEIGHNERLVARALATWSGDRTGIRVATKGGLRRRGRAWVPDGRAKHIASACEASRRALGVDAIDLYQLHAVDPRTPLETSVRALARLVDAGVVREIGLCNVTVGQIAAARRIITIAAVQVELHPFHDTNLRNGVVEYCRDHGVRLIAYRPFGGDRHARIARDPTLLEVARRHDATPYQVALAWLVDLAPGALPIPGAGTVENAAALAGALRIVLTDNDRQQLDRRIPGGRLMRVPRAVRRPPDDADGDVVLLMGYPGAGKSTMARELESQGYGRLNRDTLGGRVAELVPRLDEGLRTGPRRWVLDNTFPTRAARNLFIEMAWTYGVPVRCVWLTTTKEDAQVNAITRLVERYGHLPSPEQIRALGKTDPAAFGPPAQFRYERELEPPVADEGFARIEAVGFHRARGLHDGRAVILEYDGVLCVGTNGDDIPRTPDDVVVQPRWRETLMRHRAAGWNLLATAWRPQVARGFMTADLVTACFTQTRQLLGMDIEFRFCPHDAGPPVCWCRKPLPGLPIEFAVRRGIDLTRSVIVGRSPADETLARHLGMRHRGPEDFLQDRVV